MKTIFHIGMQKTGSKAIQNYILKHSHEKHILHPQSGREGGWHQPLFLDLVNKKTNAIIDLSNELNQSDKKFSFVSCELFYMLSLEEINIIKKKLGSVLVVLFIRNQSDFINSMYNQLIKAHKITYNQVSQFMLNYLTFNNDLNYCSVLKKWEDVFGVNSVYPVIYDKKISSTKKLFQELNLKPLYSNEYEVTKNPNPALDIQSILTILCVKKLNKHDNHLPSLMTKAHELLKENFIDSFNEQSYSLLSDKSKYFIENLYQPLNENLRRVYFPNDKVLFESERTKDFKKQDLHIDKSLINRIFEESGVRYCKMEMKKLKLEKSNTLNFIL